MEKTGHASSWFVLSLMDIKYAITAGLRTSRALAMTIAVLYVENVLTSSCSGNQCASPGSSRLNRQQWVTGQHEISLDVSCLCQGYNVRDLGREGLNGIEESAFKQGTAYGKSPDARPRDALDPLRAINAPGGNDRDVYRLDHRSRQCLDISVVA